MATWIYQIGVRMGNDEEIRSGLRNAGVPEFVFGTTLLKENAPTLRAMVEAKELVRPTSARGVYMHPAKPAQITQARKLFYLTAKELFLTGVTVCCIPLSRLMEALSTDDFVGEASRVERVRMVMVLDFYEDGAAFPFTPAEAAKLRAWVRNRFEAGNAVSFLSDVPLSRCSAWWPQSFLGFINDNVIIHSV